MTSPTPTIVEPGSGGKFYEINGEKYPRVTAILDPLASPGLVPWSGWLAAKTACEDVPALLAAMLVAECGRTHYRCQHTPDVPCSSECPCRKCLPCVERKLSNMHRSESARRAREGGEFHRYAETWVLRGGERRTVPPEVAPYARAFDSFVTDFGLTPESWYFCEAIAINFTERYAGTCDGAIIVKATTTASTWLVAAILGITEDEAKSTGRSVKILIDYKTREKPSTDEDGERIAPIKLYPSQAMQLTAYRRSEKLYVKQSGTCVTMPTFDGAALVQLRPDGYTVRPVVADDRTYAAFLSQKAVFEWETEYGTASVSVRSFKPAKPVKATRPRKATTAPTPDGEPSAAPAKVAPRKRAAKAAAPAAPAASIAEQTRAAVLGTATTVVDKPQATLFPAEKPAHPNSPYNDDIPF